MIAHRDLPLNEDILLCEYRLWLLLDSAPLGTVRLLLLLRL